MHKTDPADVMGVILAGGLSRRMAGQEKASLALNGKTLLERMVFSLTPQVATLAINANGDASRFASFGLPVFPDLRTDFPGPLAGIETALTMATMPWVLTVPTDLPFLPQNLVWILCQATQDPVIPVTVATGERLHPTVALWPRQIRPKITEALDAGQLALGQWFAGHPHRVVEFPLRADAPDPFFNINTPMDLAAAHQWLECGLARS
ncbi:MAG: molybdenum cofactor guanylyltransferase MobA [Magnetococcales bacterium]|nr:molybdenum cofactor guanylyltransferase MobA [Magnetococcales bacterium]